VTFCQLAATQVLKRSLKIKLDGRVTEKLDANIFGTITVGKTWLRIAKQVLEYPL
jgi:hypothetical protein